MHELKTPEFLKALRPSTFACRCCQYYAPEGRRGGHCQRLGAPVRGDWTACSLMIPAFKSSRDHLDGIVLAPEGSLAPAMATVPTS